jgi:putative hydrolase of the HAD superfamily
MPRSPGSGGGAYDRGVCDRSIRGLIVDWGGVMTNPLPDMVRAWIIADNIEYDSYAAVMRQWIDAYQGDGSGNPVHALERGECSGADFERLLAAQIICQDGSPVLADGLLDRMFAASTVCDPMHDLVRAARAAGVRTALLSNSWGVGGYPSHLFGELFDVVVISAQVGMRKPEPRIFQHAAGLLGLPPQECVFIDDIEVNVQAAAAVGMTARWHTSPADTTTWLRGLLDLRPPPAAPPPPGAAPG